MMRTTVRLPEELKLRAQEMADRQGISLAQLVRESLERRLDAVEDWRDDPLFSEVPVYEGAVPPELTEEHDRDPYEEHR